MKSFVSSYHFTCNVCCSDVVVYGVVPMKYEEGLFCIVPEDKGQKNWLVNFLLLTRHGAITSQMSSITITCHLLDYYYNYE